MQQLALWNKNDWKRIKFDELDEVKKMKNQIAELRECVDVLLKELKGSITIKSEKTYLLEVDKQLKAIKNPVFYETIKTDLPLAFLKVENGQIVEDKKKVGIL